MSNRTSEADKAVRIAWNNEKQLVLEGKGTRDWTLEEQRSILEKGRACDEDGKTFEGHHMKSVEAYPEFQGEANNIQFLSKKEHFIAHGGNTQNPTNGCYIPMTDKTKDFGEGLYEPCDVIDLSNKVSESRGFLLTKEDTGITEVKEIDDADNGANHLRNHDFLIPDSMNQSPIPTMNGDGAKTIKLENPKKAVGFKSIRGFIDVTAKSLGFDSPSDMGLHILKKIPNLLIVFVPIVIEEITRKSLRSNKKGINSQEMSHSSINSDDTNCITNDHLESCTIANSPYKERIVPPHSQRYGKDKVLKEKDEYISPRRLDDKH